LRALDQQIDVATLRRIVELRPEQAHPCPNACQLTRGLDDGAGLPSSTPNAESEPFSRLALNEINDLAVR
jgi:hypothetical protein